MRPPPPPDHTQTYELRASDRSLLVMPLFHVHGLMAGLLSPLVAGAAVILPAAGRFSAGTFWGDAVQHGATYYTGAGRGRAGRGQAVPVASFSLHPWRAFQRVAACPSTPPASRLMPAPSTLCPPPHIPCCSRAHHAPDPAVPRGAGLPRRRAAAPALHP